MSNSLCFGCDIKCLCFIMDSPGAAGAEPEQSMQRVGSAVIYDPPTGRKSWAKTTETFILEPPLNIYQTVMSGRVKPRSAPCYTGHCGDIIARVLRH